MHVTGHSHDKAGFFVTTRTESDEPTTDSRKVLVVRLMVVPGDRQAKYQDDKDDEETTTIQKHLMTNILLPTFWQRRETRNSTCHVPMSTNPAHFVMKDRKFKELVQADQFVIVSEFESIDSCLPVSKDFGSAVLNQHGSYSR